MKFRHIFVLAALGLATTWLSADTVYLKNGKRVEGTFLGGNSRLVRFLTLDGRARSFRLNQIESIRFGQDSSSGPAAPARAGDVIPKGTILIVRLLDSVDSDRDSVGQVYRAQLDKPLEVNAKTVAPEGTPVRVELKRVEQSGKLKGREVVTLQLKSISIGGRDYPLRSGDAEVSSEGKGGQSAKVIGATTALGAIIGAIAGGGKGAAIGAAAGAGGGVAIQASRGKRIRVPSETVLGFRLQESVPLR